MEAGAADMQLAAELPRAAFGNVGNLRIEDPQGGEPARPHMDIEAAQAGVNGYVIKPFTPDAIRDKLQLLGLVSYEESA